MQGFTRDAASVGLHRVEVATAAGTVVARVGPHRSETALLLLHGAAGTWSTWTPLLATLGAADDVVAPDLPGWGESGDAADVRRVEDLTDAVAASLAALGYGSWRVIGHSLGGFVALDLAARYPTQTLGVVLVSPTGPTVLDAVRRPFRGGRRLPWFAGMLLIMRTLAALGAGGAGGRGARVGGLGGALVRGIRRLGLLPLFAAPLFAGRADRAVADALADEIRPRSFARGARYAARYDDALWRGIRAPVRAVRGERDVFSGAADARAFRDVIPSFRETRLTGAGHFAHIERPEAVLAALDETR